MYDNGLGSIPNTVSSLISNVPSEDIDEMVNKLQASGIQPTQADIDKAIVSLSSLSPNDVASAFAAIRAFEGR